MNQKKIIYEIKLQPHKENFKRMYCISPTIFTIIFHCFTKLKSGQIVVII